MSVCRDICGNRNRPQSAGFQDGEDDCARYMENLRMQEEENSRRNADPLAKYHNLYGRGMVPHPAYPPPPDVMHRLGYPGGGYPGRSTTDGEPVLIDLMSNQKPRSGMGTDFNAMRNKAVNPNMFPGQPRSPQGARPSCYYNTAGQDRAQVKPVTSNANILSEKNPDIFKTSPRPGGYLRISEEPTPKAQPYLETCEHCSNIYEQELHGQLAKRTASIILSPKVPIHPVMRETQSREFRIKRALEESDWETMIIDDTDTVVGISNPYHVSMNMLAVTITCVMMMASNIDVTKDYLEWADGYLGCIKDENNRIPRNIAGILNEIRKRKDQVAEKAQQDEQDAKLAAAASQAQAADGAKKETPPDDEKKNKSCKSTCTSTSRKGKPGQCTVASSCTANKNLCAGFRIPNPCPNLRIPTCNSKCTHIPTIDDFVSPTQSQSSKRQG